MKLKILSINDRGSLKKEAVFMVTHAKVNLSNYIIFDTTYTENGDVSDKVRHSFRFPSTVVDKGDCVALYTGTGKEGVENVNVEGEIFKVHKLYWGLKEHVWNDDGDCALLIEIADSTDFGVTEGDHDDD